MYLRYISDTTAIVGIWDDSIGDCPGPKSTFRAALPEIRQLLLNAAPGTGAVKLRLLAWAGGDQARARGLGQVPRNEVELDLPRPPNVPLLVSISWHMGSLEG